MRSKNEIRADLAARLRLPAEMRAEKSARLCAAIAESAAWSTARAVALFAAQPREPDVDLLWPHGDGKTFAFPRVAAGGLALFRVASLHELAFGTFGVREPPAELARAVAPETLDLILVPGVAFTLAGERLGRGGGFYDRLLAMLPVRVCKIGVCFDVQILAELPVETHDCRVDFLATERGLVAVAAP